MDTKRQCGLPGAERVCWRDSSFWVFVILVVLFPVIAGFSVVLGIDIFEGWGISSWCVDGGDEFSDIFCCPGFESVDVEFLDGSFTVAVEKVVESGVLGFESVVARTCGIFVFFRVRMPETASEMRWKGPGVTFVVRGESSVWGRCLQRTKPLAKQI